MEQLDTLADERQTAFCAHCGGETKTRDHVPSRVLLDEPFPSNLPVVFSCRDCNEGLSTDEAYVACLVECALAGSTAPPDLQRAKVRRLLTEKPALAARLASALHEGSVGHTVRRVHRVVLKLARGHAAFELNEPRLDEPSSLSFAPLVSLPPASRRRFESAPDQVLWPEVGSRGMQRLASSDMRVPGWLVVQPGRYRYLAFVDDAVTVRFVLSEYLACEVVWR